MPHHGSGRREASVRHRSRAAGTDPPRKPMTCDEADGRLNVNEQRQPPAPTGSWAHPREPRQLAGRAGVDVDNWLGHYQPVSLYNPWNAVAK
ncbi:hypothetical protein HPB48_023502 [Haemaphysalis longicornis]|uniref:Uncharacterized protein n=1 Tax=Haemaphysalis longicornis TaxID=44386 RepID=A0A9J6H847_HAELO|nr:hypothetical protein HPB48_023502 [Haemaphysalis longicornis]